MSIYPIAILASVVAFAAGCAAYAYAPSLARWIRARFKRNVPGPRFAGANRNPPPPCVPIQRPLRANYPPMPLPIPPPPEEEAAIERRRELGESLRVASSILSRGTCSGERTATGYACESDHFERLVDCPNGSDCPGCGRIVAAPPPEPSPEDEAERERAGEAMTRACKINVMAERLFVEHRCDPEQAYADAVRWVDSRVAVALAEGRDPDPAPGAVASAAPPGADEWERLRVAMGAVTFFFDVEDLFGWSGDRVDTREIDGALREFRRWLTVAESPDGLQAAPSSSRATVCPFCFSGAFAVGQNGRLSCSNCEVSSATPGADLAQMFPGPRIPILRCPEHAESFPTGDRCPICADPERRAQFDARIEASRRRRLDLPSDASGEDVARALAGERARQCAKSGQNRATSEDAPATGVESTTCHAPDFGPQVAPEAPAHKGDPFAAAQDAANATGLRVDVEGKNGAVTFSAYPDLEEPDIRHRFNDTERLLGLVEPGRAFDASVLLALANDRDPGLGARLTVERVGGRLRRMAAAGTLSVAFSGKPGRGGRLPIYLLPGGPFDDPEDAKEPADEVAPEDPEPAEPEDEPTPPRSLIPDRPEIATSGSAAARCLVHGIDFAEGSLCPRCLGAPRVPARPARRA